MKVKELREQLNIEKNNNLDFQYRESLRTAVNIHSDAENKKVFAPLDLFSGDDQLITGQ